MKKLLLSLLLSLCLCLPLGATEVSCPDVNSTDVQVKAELSTQGLTKLANWGAQLAVDQLESKPLTPRLDPIALQLPNEVLEPADAGDFHADLHNDSLSFANTKITLQSGAVTNKKCDTTGCEFTVPIQKFNLTSDLTLAPNEKGAKKPLFTGKGISMSLNPSGAAPFSIKVKLDPKGRVANLISVDPKQLSLSLKLNALNLSLAMSAKQIQTLGPQISAAIYDGLKKNRRFKDRIKGASTPAEKVNVIRGLAGDIVDSDDYKLIQSNATNVVLAPVFFNNDLQSAKLFESGQWLFTQLQKNQLFMKTINDLIAKEGAPALAQTINDQLGKLPLLKEPINLSVPFVRLQDLMDQSAVQKAADDQAGNWPSSSVRFKTRKARVASTPRFRIRRTCCKK